MTQETIIQELHSRYFSELEKINHLILSYLKHSKEELIYEIGDYLIKSGGKRIRPILTIISAQLFHYSGIHHITLAAATEFIHAATLLHDDVVDSSLMRRFKPTANSVWGNQAAILVGDYLFSQAFKLMVSTESIASLQTLANASGIIASGEVAQLKNIQTSKEISKADYFETIEAKTAELFAASCKVGAIISNADFANQELIYSYGKNVGLIFQIKDDMLDYFSNILDIGKNTGDDFLEGKITLPIIILLENAEEKDKKIIRNFFQKAEKRDKDDLEKIISFMQKYEVECEVESLIQIHAKKALKSLSMLTIKNQTNLEDLEKIIQFASQRKN